MINNLINVFLEPREVFTSLKEQNDWKNALIPIVISVLVGIASMMALGELLVEYQISETERAIMESSQIPEDKKEEMLEDSLSGIMDPSPAMIAIGYFTSAISIPVRILFMALIIMRKLGSAGESTINDLSMENGGVYRIGIIGIGRERQFSIQFYGGDGSVCSLESDSFSCRHECPLQPKHTPFCNCHHNLLDLADNLFSLFRVIIRINP